MPATINTALTLTFYADPAHGWLAVPAAEVRRLGIVPSRYSYRSPSGAMVYLEEDCDATAYFQALARHGEPRPEIRERHSNSPSFIRRLDRCC